MKVIGSKILLVRFFIWHERSNCYEDLLDGFYEMLTKIIKRSFFVLKVGILKFNKTTF